MCLYCVPRSSAEIGATGQQANIADKTLQRLEVGLDVFREGLDNPGRYDKLDARVSHLAELRLRDALLQRQQVFGGDAVGF